MLGANSIGTFGAISAGVPAADLMLSQGPGPKGVNAAMCLA
jgi:hypothetical protein